MGGCFSCCGRRQKQSYQPLLSHDEENPELPASKKVNLSKLTEALGAFSAGKLPSETQAERILQTCLKSDILRYAAHFGGPGPLSATGRKVLENVKELIEALLQAGMEKNYDDSIQELYFHCTLLSRQSASVNVDVATKPGTVNGGAVFDAIPPSEEVGEDMKTATKSIRTLASLLFTSTAFRVILSDFFITSRELLADGVARIGSIAATIEAQAQKTENVLRPGEVLPTAQEKVEVVGEETKRHWEEIKEDAPDRVRTAFLSRWQDILERAQQEPEYRVSSLTLLSLVRKYYKRFYTAASTISSANVNTPSVFVSTQVDLDPNLTSVMKHLRQLLERFARNQSLQPLFDTIERTLQDLSHSPAREDIKTWLEEAGRYLQRSLSEDSWLRSEKGQRTAEKLYDRAEELLEMDANSPWVNDLKHLLNQIDDLFLALKTDRTTERLLRAGESLRTDMNEVIRTAFGAQKQLRKEIQQDIFGWFMPRFLQLLRAIPMPRVEFTSPSLDAAIDSVILSSASTSFIPDHINIRSSEDFLLDFSKQESGIGSLESYVRTRIHIDGVRLNAHGISYYLNYKGLWNTLGWEDNGLLDIDILKGLTIDLEVDTDSQGAESLLRILDLKLDIPGITFSIRESRHWILNKLILAPLLGPVVRQAAGWVLAKQLREGLQALDKRLYSIHNLANRNATLCSRGVIVADYWDAVVEEFQSTPDPDEEEEDNAQAISETHLTSKGIVHTTATTSSIPDETVIAIGAGEQILPGKGGPALQKDSVQAAAREAVDDLEESVQKGLGEVQEVGVEIGKGVDRTKEMDEERRRRKKVEERRQRGWRSAAFDLDVN